MRNTFGFLGICICLVTTIVRGAGSFDQVEALLNTSCVNCHRGEKASGGLRLDTAEGIARGIVPGKSADSLILQRVTATDPRLRGTGGAQPR